jgi:hypothetical protein
MWKKMLMMLMLQMFHASPDQHGGVPAVLDQCCQYCPECAAVPSGKTMELSGSGTAKKHDATK